MFGPSNIKCNSIMTQTIVWPYTTPYQSSFIVTWPSNRSVLLYTQFPYGCAERLYNNCIDFVKNTYIVHHGILKVVIYNS